MRSPMMKMSQSEFADRLTAEIEHIQTEVNAHRAEQEAIAKRLYGPDIRPVDVEILFNLRAVLVGVNMLRGLFNVMNGVRTETPLVSPDILDEYLSAVDKHFDALSSPPPYALRMLLQTEGSASSSLPDDNARRTASIVGTVTLDNEGLPGIAIRLSRGGLIRAQAVTDDHGQYAFTGLPSGRYGVTISRFDVERVTFPKTRQSVAIDEGESKIVSFEAEKPPAPALR
ncbi:MAG: carboxypeptidase regulatory-like domain-containing protein [Gemmatimonadetes bacterium]|nr:carboxypeptidase regulatory-like domain-containing protein [Gemmatimonadota bacterium]